MIVLLTTIYVKTPLEFSIFPSLLLATTLGRLVLNVASTRLILTRAQTDQLEAAGDVIRSFGEFVAGDKVVVGLIIFVIIIVIQFVVITKGATRISEVAARFALDGMPGRQMAIDADLNAGAIDEKEAQRRRSEITQQADFYGAMDGASKFVRGDAIAGIIITLINIVGGLVIGVFEAEMGLERGGRVVHEADDRRRAGEPGSGVPDLVGSWLAGDAQHAEVEHAERVHCSRYFHDLRPWRWQVVSWAFWSSPVCPRIPLLTIGKRLWFVGRDAFEAEAASGGSKRTRQPRRKRQPPRSRKSGLRTTWLSIRWRSKSGSG